MQPAWAATIRRPMRVVAFAELIEDNVEELARLLNSEHGKVVDDAKGDVQRGAVVEFAYGIPHVLKGEYTQGADPHRCLFHAPAARHRRGHHAGTRP